jgi:hypothetical protein
MPYEIVREDRGAYKRFWGVVTPTEFLDSLIAFHSDPHFERFRYTIQDFTETAHLSLTESHIEDAAAICVGASFTNPNIRILAVTTDPGIIGMAKKYDQVTRTDPILIFPTLDEARHWVATSRRTG